MSRIGKRPIPVPAGVTVSVDPGRVMVSGPLGMLTQTVPARMQIEREGDEILVTRPTERGDSFDMLVVELKFGRNRERILTDLKRVSTPGRRVYARKDRLPRVLGGLGTAILSTSSGVVTARTAEERGIGGEVVCFVW